MKFPLSWLEEKISHELSPSELGERLTLAGLELEDIVKLASTPIDKIEPSNETHFMLGKKYQIWVNNYRNILY